MVQFRILKSTPKLSHCRAASQFWLETSVTKLCNLEVCHKWKKYVMLMIVAYHMQLNKSQVPSEAATGGVT